MAGLRLIQNGGEWTAYTRSFEVENNIVGQVNWGVGPALFPCLVASLPNGTGRVASCYVYPDQAEMLVQAARRKSGPVPLPPPVTPATVPAPAPEARTLTLGEVEQMIKQQAAVAVGGIFREVVANVRAIVSELVEVAITTPERYETLLVKHLADVDQYMAGKRMPADTSAPNMLTRRMFPEDECEGA